MTGPITIIDVSDILPGRVSDVEAGIRGLVEFVRVREPRILHYAATLGTDPPTLTVIQVHPDAASAELHFQVAAPEFQKFGGLLRLRSMAVHGTPTARLRELLDAKARLLGGPPAMVYPLSAGFARS